LDADSLASAGTLSLPPLAGTVVIDEAQRRPDLFPVLRVLADEDRRPGRFLVLGSASPDLVGLAAESLAIYGAEEATKQIINRLETEMKAAAKELKFERAAVLRNRIRALKLKELELKPEV